MVEGSGAESNGFSLIDIFDGGTIRLTGFRKQSSHEWK
jgi:alkaline phosphatase